MTLAPTARARAVRNALPVGLAGALAATGFASGGYFAPAVTGLAVALSFAAAMLLLLGAPLHRLAVVQGGLLGVVAAEALAHGTSLEATRIGAYGAAAVVAAALVTSAEARLVAVVSATAVVSAWALVTLSLPTRFERLDALSGQRLSEPVDYWNALGIVAVLGLLSALALVAGGRLPAIRAIGGTAVPVLAATMYLTFSRGAWVSLAIGVAAALLIAAERTPVAAAVAATAPFAALAIATCARQHALTHVGGETGTASVEGRRLLVVVLLLSVASAAAAAFAPCHRASVRPVVARAAVAALAAALFVGSMVAVTRLGTPSTLAARAQAAFAAPPGAVDNLNERLFSLSGNGRRELWVVAIREFRSHPLAGTGAGSFERHWLRDRTIPLKVRDAHSLYLETAAELGVVGLVALLVALAVPLYAVLAGRRDATVAAASGAYVAYLVHAAVDWDWEMPVVTIAALVIGTAVVVGAERRVAAATLSSLRARHAALATCVLLLGLALVGLAGSVELSTSADAARRADWPSSLAAAERARRWAPRSAEPYRRIGEARLGLAQPERARAAFLDAVAKAPEDWNAWLDLARASTGRAQREALAHASALNPLSPEVARFRHELGASG